MCPYSELFWSVYSRIRTEYGQTRSICLYSVRIRENVNHNDSEYGHFTQCRFFRVQVFQEQVFQGPGFSGYRFFGSESRLQKQLSQTCMSLFCENGCIVKNGKNANFDKNEKCVLKNFPNFTGKRLCRNLSFNKVSNLRNATSLKKRLRRRYFLVNF